MEPTVALNSTHEPPGPQSPTDWPSTSLIAGSTSTFCIIGCCKTRISIETISVPWLLQTPSSNMSWFALPSLQYTMNFRLKNWSPDIRLGLMTGMSWTAGYLQGGNVGCFGRLGMKMGALSDTPSSAAATCSGSLMGDADRYGEVPGFANDFCISSLVPKVFSMHRALQTNLTRSRPLENFTVPSVPSKNSFTMRTSSSEGPAMLLTSSREKYMP
mmetsp:Transcript_171623/g.550098  ORF Transcript_171623/g.550098 Transcript_171623/m.550098 type:complete len:215 (-) Transcript_171623:339-983(-)